VSLASTFNYFPCADLTNSLPPHYRNPNAFYRRRPHESPEDFKKRLLSETWEEKRRLLGIGPSCPPKDEYVSPCRFVCNLSRDQVSDIRSTSPDEATLLSVPKKCESCIAFNIHAPHLNDLSECTCDGNRCTRLDPCSLCEGLTQGDIALCKEGPDQHLDHEHATKCFLHTRLAILSHETFHRATVGAARLVIVPATVSPAREDCTGKTPCSVCKRLLGMGKLACKKCRKRKYEHWHARFCFNCLRRYFNSKSQDFHLSIVTAARIVGMPTPSSGLADTLVYPMPKDIASDKASENGMLMWDLIGAGSVILGSSSAPTAGNVVLACSAAPSSSSSLAGASENCTPATPCSICESLIATGTAYCMDCRRCEFDHQHAKRCFNCLRQYLLQSQPFHVATVAAARIVGLSGVPRGLDVTPVHPMPEDHAWDILTENNALMWDLIRAGEVVVGCPSALTPSDTACDSETEDEEVGEVDDDSSAAISPRPASHEPELMEVVAQQMEEVAEPISPRPTSPEPELEPESMEIVIQQVEEDTTPPSPRPAPPCPEHMEIVTQQVEEDAGPTSPRPTSLDPEPVEIVAQQVEDVVVPTSPHPASPEPEPMEIVTHQIEEDAQPPSPPNTRGHKRKRRLSQCLSPTPEPRSSASPDPIPRTFHRPTHLPAFRYEPTRSPSPALAIRADLNLPQQSLTYTNNPPPPAAIPSSALANAIPQPPPPPTDVMDYAAVRRSREHRAWMEVQEKRNFHSQRERLRVEREGFARQLRDVERQDREVRMREVERLRGEIVRLEGEE
jgi:hypothetical protein